MNRRQLEYAVRLAEVRNFSQLSEELGISQPALSKQISALEQELDVKLFDRTSSPLTLTPAGAHFTEEARRLVYAEDQLKRTMAQFQSGEAGRLTVGVSPFRCMYLMPKIIKAVREKFPQVEIMLHELPSAQLRHETAEGKFDFSILNLPVDDSMLEAIPIQSETLVLAVPNTMAASLPFVQNGEEREVEFADCKDLPFITVSEGQEMRQMFDKICARSQVYPPIAAQVVGGITTAWALAYSGLGATILPLSFVQEDYLIRNVTLFTIRGSAYIRQPAVVTKRGQYVSPYAAYAIKLLTT